ncbi:MAG: porin [Burkholderiaceae bacterium]
MKKTLIALAAVAVTSTAMAQVTLSGQLAYAWESTSSADAISVDTNGLGVTDGNLTFRASEDLGGGMKISTSQEFVSRGRDTAMSGRNATISLSGGFGTFTIGAIEAANGILGLGGADAPTYGLDGATLAAAGNVDIAMLTLPSMNGFTVALKTLDGTAGGLHSQGGNITSVQLKYGAGPLAASIDSTSYGSLRSAGANSRTRMSASYDLGVAKVGFGYEDNDKGLAADKKERLVGISIPMGSMLFGINVASSKTTGVVGNNKGTDLGMKYSLSKQTSVFVQYQTTKAAGATNSASKYRVKLHKAF